MSWIQVNITTDLDKVPNVEEILPKEFVVVNGWKEQGFLEHLFIKDDKSGAVLVFKDIDEARAKDLIATLPLHPHMEKVEYLVVEKAF